MLEGVANKRLEQAVDQAIEQGRKYVGQGEVATYIPELGRADSKALGATLARPGGWTYSAGDCDQPFTLQSVSKVFALLLALDHFGPKEVFERVGMEPTGDPFNSLLKLELLEPSKPLNPMINAGALAVCGLLVEGWGDEAFDRLAFFVRQAAKNPAIDIDSSVYHSERLTADRNRALAYFLKDAGAIRVDVEKVLDIYFRQCSLQVTCADLAQLGLFLAVRDTSLGGKIENFRTVNAFLVTCGMYNASGEFAVRVGLPAKSGVSGAVLALVPDELGIGVYGPALESRGNSVGGVEFLVALSRELNLSIF